MSHGIPVGTILYDGSYNHDMRLLQAYGGGLSYWTFRDGEEGVHRNGDSDPREAADVYGIRRPEEVGDTVVVDTDTPRYARAYQAMLEAGKPLYVWLRGQAFRAPEPGSGVIDDSSSLRFLAILS